MTDLAPIEPTIPGKTAGEQMLWMADAYAKGAALLCTALAEDDYEHTYASTRVVLHLCRHATELFLKGAVAVRKKEPPLRTHRLDRLYAEYKRLFPRDKHQVQVPFPAEAFDPDRGLFPGTLEEFQRTHDQRFRYPIDSAGRPFGDCEPFDVAAYNDAIEKFRTELNLMVARIAWDFDF